MAATRASFLENDSAFGTLEKSLTPESVERGVAPGVPSGYDVISNDLQKYEVRLVA
jgi:hypothetical protein